MRAAHGPLPCPPTPAGVTPTYFDNAASFWDGFKTRPKGPLLTGTKYFQSYGRFGDGRSPPQTLLRDVVVGSPNLYVCAAGSDDCIISLEQGGDVTVGLCSPPEAEEE